ncbi:hypothetical protein GWK47_037599 [Chionoecetes opilio]|uniref:Uncharacterized protein n=1 Tax=Chionoecetes opilio TaxID=41210 RepID=A0A8J5D1C6_CHIOP|nr:hypothetical protein GWK47_037599 [Chionoecetes opilio]
MPPHPPTDVRSWFGLSNRGALPGDAPVWALRTPKNRVGRGCKMGQSWRRSSPPGKNTIGRLGAEGLRFYVCRALRSSLTTVAGVLGFPFLQILRVVSEVALCARGGLKLVLLGPTSPRPRGKYSTLGGNACLAWCPKRHPSSSLAAKKSRSHDPKGPFKDFWNKAKRA